MEKAARESAARQNQIIQSTFRLAASHDGQEEGSGGGGAGERAAFLGQSGDGEGGTTCREEA